MQLSLLMQFGLLYFHNLLFSKSVIDGPYLIKSPVGKCIDVHGPDVANNGAKVQVWDCNGADHQNWFYDPSTKLLRVGSKQGNCLSVGLTDYFRGVNGAVIVTWLCDIQDPPNQKFDIVGQSIVSQNGKCLDVYESDQNNNGGVIRLSDCLDVSNQKWLLKKPYCFAVDFKRVAILETADNQVGNTENWDLTDNGFTMTMKSNFASYSWPQWTGCTYTYRGPFVNIMGVPCDVPSLWTSYVCYMAYFPTIYLTESQMNAGLLVDVYGEIGDNNDAVLWDYEFRFTEWNADDVRNGVKESYATRTSPGGRKGRHFFKYTYTDDSNCNLNINEFFDCD